MPRILENSQAKLPVGDFGEGNQTLEAGLIVGTLSTKVSLLSKV
jgi:hypothetical protein